jgi:hypothetical protein
VLELAVSPETYQQPQAITRRFQVIVNGGTMFVGQLPYGFDLDNGFVKAMEVGPVGLLERPIFRRQLEFRLTTEWNATQFELDFETFLVHRFQEAGTLVVVDLEAGPDDGVCLVFEQDFHWSSPEEVNHKSHQSKPQTAGIQRRRFGSKSLSYPPVSILPHS